MLGAPLWARPQCAERQNQPARVAGVRVLARAVVVAGLAPFWLCAASAYAQPEGAASPADGQHGAAPAAQGQTPVSQTDLIGRPVVTIRRTEVAPSIDGRLNDPVWRTAARVTDFFQRPGRAVEGAPASEETEIFIAYDSQHIYIGIYAHYADPGIIRANRVDRDGTQNDDKVAVYLDPFLDQQRAYTFSVNPYGVQRDYLMSGAGSGGGGDNAWDALYDSAGTFVKDGWTAEMAIPFKSIRYPARGPGEMHRWGLQLERDIEHRNEAAVWAPMSSNVMGFIRQMGVLEGLSDLSTSRNLELLPTITAIDVGKLNRETGAFGRQDVKEGGLNVKYGFTPNLTFDFTYNPDFSQIESDVPQIEVNQRFPLFFPELRPFFLEGREIYQIPAPVTVVHTRTIVDPRYGVKLTGKVGRTAVGLLVTDDEGPGNVDDPADPAFGRTAQVILARVRYDLRAASHIGALFTNREFLDGFSRLAAIDARWQIGQNNSLTLNAMTTQHRDEAGQASSGELVQLRWRTESRGLTYDIDSYMLDPGFRTEAGFVRRTDEWRTRANVNYRWWPENWVVNWGPEATYERNLDRDGELQDEVLGAGVNVQFARYIRANVGYSREMERFRGIDFWKTRVSLGGTVNTSRRLAVSALFNTGDQIRFVASPFLGSSRDLSLTLTLRPLARLQSALRVNMSRLLDRRTRVDRELFDVKIFRSLTTYQFTNRFLIRNITEYHTFDRMVNMNVLFTYRVNAGTVFFVGYDDHYRQGNQINAAVFPTAAWRRTNRAIFTKLQHLFRY